MERLLKQEEPAQAIVFCRTKRGTDKVHLRLTKRFKDVACIHGDLAQNVRDRVMAAFREGKVKVLVATDVVGRGIDVTGISHIVNYDIPQFCDDYVHRVGRTGRMGREGVAYTFVTPEEGSELTRIEMRIDRLLAAFRSRRLRSRAKNRSECRPLPMVRPLAKPAAEEPPKSPPRADVWSRRPSDQALPPSTVSGPSRSARPRRFQPSLLRLSQSTAGSNAALLETDFRQHGHRRSRRASSTAVGWPARIIVARRLGVAQHDGGHGKAAAKRRRDGQGLQRLIDDAQSVAATTTSGNPRS